jgi:hypothetical protein
VDCQKTNKKTGNSYKGGPAAEKYCKTKGDARPTLLLLLLKQVFQKGIPFSTTLFIILIRFTWSFLRVDQSLGVATCFFSTFFKLQAGAVEQGD